MMHGQKNIKLLSVLFL